MSDEQVKECTCMLLYGKDYSNCPGKDKGCIYIPKIKRIYRLPFFLRPCFYEALYKWKSIEWMWEYEFLFAWWRSRCRLIRRGQI